MAKYYWLKIEEEFFRQKEVKALRMLRKGPTYILIYEKMLVYSLKNDNRFYFDRISESFEDEIALVIDEKAEDVKFVIDFLQERHLVRMIDKRELVMVTVENLTGEEKTSTNRVRKHRENKKKEKAKEAEKVKEEEKTEVTTDEEDDNEVVENDEDDEKSISAGSKEEDNKSGSVESEEGKKEIDKSEVDEKDKDHKKDRSEVIDSEENKKVESGADKKAKGNKKDISETIDSEENKNTESEIVEEDLNNKNIYIDKKNYINEEKNQKKLSKTYENIETSTIKGSCLPNDNKQCNNYETPCNKFETVRNTDETLDKEKDKELEKELEIDTDKYKTTKVTKCVNGCVDENLKKIVNIYEQNIGKIYPADRQWFIDVSEEFPWNLFEEGIKTCIDRNHVTPGYLKGIVQNWRTRGITTVSEFKADKVEHGNRGRSFNYEPRGTNSHGVGVISARNSHQMVTAEQLAQMAKRESMMELD